MPGLLRRLAGSAVGLLVGPARQFGQRLAVRPPRLGAAFLDLQGAVHRWPCPSPSFPINVGHDAGDARVIRVNALRRCSLVVRSSVKRPEAVSRMQPGREAAVTEVSRIVCKASAKVECPRLRRFGQVEGKRRPKELITVANECYVLEFQHGGAATWPQSML